jgi:DNA (cytosine-5)-methyltransferase 1
MRVGSLFTGYGGLEMAIDGELAWTVENDPAASRLIAHRYPGVPNMGDITAVEWADVEPVDILAGGFPCQDVSIAGLRAGMHDETRSGLWSHMALAVSVLRPRYVVIENVRGLLSATATGGDMEPCPVCVGNRHHPAPTLRALGAVLGDLADIGYDAQWCGLRASDVGAPHGRFRVFVVATDTERVGRDRRPRQPLGGPLGGIATARGRAGAGTTADTQSTGREIRFTEQSAPTLARPGVGGGTAQWGQYGPAIRRWETILGREAPAPTMAGPRGGQRLSPVFVEWIMGLPNGWVTDVPGLTWADKIKILGNGVVPQQARAALKTMAATWL